MSIQNYALLSGDLSTVIDPGPIAIDSTIVAAWVAAGNPKGARFRLINMIAQPAFDATTQVCTQNGWTITTVDVQPVWQVVALSTTDQNAIAGQTEFQNLVAGNLVAYLHNSINNWATLTAAQKDTLLLRLTRAMVAIVRAQFGVQN
jgi:hypothetical protein